MRFRRGWVSAAITATAAGAAVVLFFGLDGSGTAGNVVLTAGVAPTAVTGSGSGPTVPIGSVPGLTPAAGVHTRHFCGTQWKNVRVGNVGYNVYNDDFGAKTCLSNSNNPGFGLYYSAVNGSYEAFPNISSGWEWGVAPLHGYTFPVRMKNDGTPLSSVSFHPVNSGVYNAAYDMWFSTYAQKKGQDNGAEVMIWLDCRHNCIGGGSPVVRIEGIKFREDSWITYHNGVHWRYTAFVAVTHRASVKNLWLNPFYRAAHVNPNWYLTSIDFGFELVSGGKDLRVNSFSLSRVN